MTASARISFLSWSNIRSTLPSHSHNLSDSQISESESAANKLQSMFEGNGLLLRTFECYRAPMLSELETFERCARKELNGEHAPTWESGATRTDAKLIYIPGSFVRTELPKSAYPNSLVKWNWHVNSFRDTFCVGIVLPPPKRSLRGPSWPNDAFVSDVRLAYQRYECSPADMESTKYAWRRWNQIQTGAAKKCDSFAWSLAYNRSITCWSTNWDSILAMQAAFWNHVDKAMNQSGSFLRNRGCYFGTPWNQMSFDRTHARTAVAIFYGNFSNKIGGKTPQKSTIASHARRSLNVALHLQQILLSPTGKKLDLVQFVADGRISTKTRAFLGIMSS